MPHILHHEAHVSIHVDGVQLIEESDEVGMLITHLCLTLGMLAPVRLIVAPIGVDRVLYTPRRKSSLMRSSVCADSTSVCRSM